MFNEREMSKAIDWLFELFSPEDYESYDEDEIGYAGGLCLPEVCTALRGAAQTVYQYSVTGGYEKCFDYRGMELFDQRACLIISDVEQAVLDEIKTTYETELWLMEDMERSSTIAELMEHRRIQAGAKEYKGHTYMDLARFDEATKHMIIFDVLTNKSPVGWKGERNRLYLSEAGYQKALDNQKAGNIKIISHANVARGNLYYDRRDMAR